MFRLVTAASDGPHSTRPVLLRTPTAGERNAEFLSDTEPVHGRMPIPFARPQYRLSGGVVHIDLVRIPARFEAQRRVLAQRFPAAPDHTFQIVARVELQAVRVGFDGQFAAAAPGV